MLNCQKCVLILCSALFAAIFKVCILIEKGRCMYLKSIHVISISFRIKPFYTCFMSEINIMHHYTEIKSKYTGKKGTYSILKSPKEFEHFKLKKCFCCH